MLCTRPQVSVESANGYGADGHLPRARALASHPQRAGIEVDRVERQTLQLRAADAGISEDADDGLIAPTGERLVALARSNHAPQVGVPQDGWRCLRQPGRLHVLH